MTNSYDTEIRYHRCIVIDGRVYNVAEIPETETGGIFECIETGREFTAVEMATARQATHREIRAYVRNG